MGLSGASVSPLGAKTEQIGRFTLFDRYFMTTIQLILIDMALLLLLVELVESLLGLETFLNVRLAVLVKASATTEFIFFFCYWLYTFGFLGNF